MCVVHHKWVWHRARIVDIPETKMVSLHLVDYGMAAKVPPEDLYFLHKNFMDSPALVMRGTLADVYPLGLHWPLDATDSFRLLVCDRDMHATVKDVDLEERILFLSMWDRNDSTITISKRLISAELAGYSRNYCNKVRAINNGRRVRYIRERLPT